LEAKLTLDWKRSTNANVKKVLSMLKDYAFEKFPTLSIDEQAMFMFIYDKVNEKGGKSTQKNRKTMRKRLVLQELAQTQTIDSQKVAQQLEMLKGMLSPRSASASQVPKYLKCICKYLD
jgi:heterodisulfide reductase subunit C